MCWHFLTFLFVCILTLGHSGEVSYAGITIECDEVCGEVDDPNFEEIMHVFTNSVCRIFHDCKVMDESCDYQLIDPWGTCDEADWDYSVWDWKSSQAFWPSQSALGPLLKEPLKKRVSITSYPQFLNVAAALREDVNFYFYQVPRQELQIYKSLLPRLKAIKDEYGSVDIYDGGKFELYGWGTYNGTLKQIPDLIRSLQYRIKICEDISYYDAKYEKKSAEIERMIEEVDALFKHIFVRCLRRHQNEGLSFHSAIENFVSGDYEKALDQIDFLISLAQKDQSREHLISKLHLLKGQVQSEFCLYSDAVISLTSAIQKNPSLKDAYFERAVAYFELGEFDRAINDYLDSGFESSSSGYKIQWASIPPISAGIAIGIVEGASESAIEFIPESLSTLRGMGKGLWAFSTDPIGSSTFFANSAMECIQYFKAHSVSAVLQDLVPELRELIQNYDQLTDYQKGKLIGHIIGKYGTDILICKYSVAAVKAYRELKRANQIMTLEALASSKTQKNLQQISKKIWADREEFLRKANLKIHESRQGKHVPNHVNYELGKNRSILDHKDPQRLIKESAGTGIKDSPSIPGTPGYKEIVDFGEPIGFVVDEATGEQFATTRGKIHYAKDGVHIVPYRPKVQ